LSPLQQLLPLKARFELEILVVDGDSADGTAELVASSPTVNPACA
jgi:glycosyltransferase involved in cell wall biosynthesis